MIQMKLDNYLRGAYGFACCFNKLYLKEFIMRHNIFCTKKAEDMFFVFQCMLHAERYIKVPKMLNVYRNLSSSTSRNLPSFEDLQKRLKSMNGLLSEFDNYMKDIDFFIQNPHYRFAVLEFVLTIMDNHSMNRYYPTGQGIIPFVLEGANQEIEKIYGENAPLVKCLFHRSHLLYQQNLELIAKIQSQS